MVIKSSLIGWLPTPVGILVGMHLIHADMTKLGIKVPAGVDNHTYFFTFYNCGPSFNLFVCYFFIFTYHVW